MEDLLLTIFLGKPLWIWAFFFTVIAVLVIIDLFILHRDQHEIGVRESFRLSSFYIGVSLLFGLFIWWNLGEELALEYYTGYIIEQSLSMDNIFVIAMIFGFFAIPRQYQHRVLFWGILGVIVLRGIMIGLGATLVAEFSWLLYVFAVFLILTGVKMIVFADKDLPVP